MGLLLKKTQKLFNNFNCMDSIASKQHYKILWKCRLTAVDRNLEAAQHNFLNLPKNNVEFNFDGGFYEPWENWLFIPNLLNLDEGLPCKWQCYKL